MKASALTTVMFIMQACYGTPRDLDDIVEINSLDGVRLTFADDSWVLVRPSGTEDYIRITLESRDSARAEAICETCLKIINDNI